MVLRPPFAALGFLLLASTAMAQMNGTATAPVAPAVPVVPAPAAAPVAIVPGAVPVAAPLPSTSMPVMPAMPVVPSANTPVTALPEVSVPSVPVAPISGAVPVTAPAKAEKPPEPALPTIEEEPAGEEAVDTPAASDSVPTEDPSGADYSYGTANYSLLFTRNQISKMKSVLAIFEARRKRGDTAIQVVEDPDEFADIAPVATPEPAVYPVFTLKSIVFRNSADWTVWIGDLRITPNKNDQEVRVIAAGPGIAQFIWKPAYSQALQQRAAGPGFAKTDAVAHKQTRPNTAAYDQETGQVSFTLRPNQTFAPAYMATFEGKIASPALPKMDEDESIAEIPDDKGAAPAVDTSAANPTNLDALLKAQQQSPLGALVRGQPNRNEPAAAQPAAQPVPTSR